MSVVSARSHFWGDFLFLFIYFVLDIWIKSYLFIFLKEQEYGKQKINANTYNFYFFYTL